MLYLNNSGSRGIPTDNRFVLVMPDGIRTVRRMVCEEAFGNFSRIVYRVKGKTFYGLPKSHDGYETRDEEATGDNALQHVFHANSGHANKD